MSGASTDGRLTLLRSRQTRVLDTSHRERKLAPSVLPSKQQVVTVLPPCFCFQDSAEGSEASTTATRSCRSHATTLAMVCVCFAQTQLGVGTSNSGMTTFQKETAGGTLKRMTRAAVARGQVLRHLLCVYQRPAAMTPELLSLSCLLPSACLNSETLQRLWNSKTIYSLILPCHGEE